MESPIGDHSSLETSVGKHFTSFLHVPLNKDRSNSFMTTFDSCVGLSRLLELSHLVCRFVLSFRIVSLDL